jgi:hypothetical protein
MKASKQAEDEYWHDEGDKNMQKKAQRQMADEEKKESQIKAKLEKQKLLDEEEKELESAKIKS